MIDISLIEVARLDIIFNASKSCLFKISSVLNENI